MPPVKTSTNPDLLVVLNCSQKWRGFVRFCPWFMTNVVVVLFLLYDVLRDESLFVGMFDKQWTTSIRYTELILLTLATLNAVCTVAKLLYSLIRLRSTHLTAKQKQLLGMDRSAIGRTLSDKTQTTDKTRTTDGKKGGGPLNLDWLFGLRKSAYRHSATGASGASGSFYLPNDTSFGSSPYSPLSRTPTLQLSSHGSSSNLSEYPSPEMEYEDWKQDASRSFSETLLRLRRSRSSTPFSNKENITSQNQLQDYLDRFARQEAVLRTRNPNSLSRSSAHRMDFTASSIISYDSDTMDRMDRMDRAPRQSPLMDFSLLESRPYQPGNIEKKETPDGLNIKSQTVDILTSREGTPTRSLPASSSSSSSSSSVWTQYEIDSNNLDLYVQNLRVWIARTILKPLIEEIDRLNEKFIAQSRPDLRIGEASFASLQHALLARSEQMPTLSQVLPYLELTSNQQYQIQRMRQLAKDGSLGTFRWNGGAIEPLPWDTHLPTDTRLIWHCFCCYLDNVLPPNPLCPDGKPFSALHFLQTPSKPTSLQSSAGLPYIHLVTEHPPHFQLVQTEEKWDVGKGKNNFFHTLLIFFKHLKLHCENRLGPISLGPSGLNLSWIMNK